MKDFHKLSADIKIMTEKMQSNVKKAVQETAEDIWNDVTDIANYGETGNFISSIDISPIEETNGSIKTIIGSDLMVTAKNGNSYNLGYLLENGTLHHAIPNAFDWGRIYGYSSPQYYRTLQDDWHPGTQAYLFYNRAGEMNFENFKTRIREAVKESIK